MDGFRAQATKTWARLILSPSSCWSRVKCVVVWMFLWALGPQLQLRKLGLDEKKLSRPQRASVTLSSKLFLVITSSCASKAGSPPSKEAGGSWRRPSGITPSSVWSVLKTSITGDPLWNVTDTIAARSQAVYGCCTSLRDELKSGPDGFQVRYFTVNFVMKGQVFRVSRGVFRKIYGR